MRSSGGPIVAAAFCIVMSSICFPAKASKVSSIGMPFRQNFAPQSPAVYTDHETQYGNSISCIGRLQKKINRVSKRLLKGYICPALTIIASHSSDSVRRGSTRLDVVATRGRAGAGMPISTFATSKFQPLTSQSSIIHYRHVARLIHLPLFLSRFSPDKHTTALWSIHTVASASSIRPAKWRA